MALDPENYERRNLDLVKEYDRRCNIKTNKGKPLKTIEAIIEELAWEFYLSEDTVEKIIKAAKR